jgi:hypothetical protein
MRKEIIVTATGKATVTLIHYSLIMNKGWNDPVAGTHPVVATYRPVCSLGQRGVLFHKGGFYFQLKWVWLTYKFMCISQKGGSLPTGLTYWDLLLECFLMNKHVCAPTFKMCGMNYHALPVENSGSTVMLGSTTAYLEKQTGNLTTQH